MRLLIILILCMLSCFAEEQNNLDIIKKSFDRVQTKTLSNGIRVVLYPRKDAPVFSAWILVHVGGVDEKQGSTGISHILEHMAFKGTPALGTKDFSKEKGLLQRLEVLYNKPELNSEELKEKENLYKQLREIWAVADFDNEYRKRGADDMNASTAKEITNYFISLPKNAFEYWCWIESERIKTPVMRQFYEERDVVMEERRMRFEDDPSGKVHEVMLSTAFTQHPYRNPVIGYLDDLKNLTATMTEEFHKKYYVGSNIVIALVGDLETKDLDLVAKYFEDISDAEPPAKDFPIEPPQLGERQVKVSFAAAPQLSIAYRKPNYPHPDDPPLSLMLEILSGSSISPLYKELVQKKQAAASISYAETPGSEYPSLFVFEIIPNAGKSNAQLIEEFDDSINNYIENGVTEEQIEIAKRSILTAYIKRLDSNLALADDLASTLTFYGDIRAGIKWLEAVQKVTAEDISRVAHQYLLKDQRTIITIEPERKK